MKFLKKRRGRTVSQNAFQPGSAPAGDHTIVFIDLSSRRPGLLHDSVELGSLLYCQGFMTLAFSDCFESLRFRI